MEKPLAFAEMPEIDHLVRQGFQGIVQLTDPLEAHQSAPELILPTEDSLDSLKLFLKNGWVENRFASTLGCLSTTRIFRNIRNHPAIENGFAVGATIVDPIQADEGLVQIESDLFGDATHFRQCCLQQRRLVTIVRCRNKRSDDVAVTVTEGNHFVAFEMLVPTEPEVVTALLCHSRRPIPVNDTDIKMPFEGQDRRSTLKNGIQAPLGFVAPKGGIDPGVMNFRLPRFGLLDRQFFPLTTEVQEFQNVVEDRVQREFRL
jgi:hypothetical protein